MNYRHIYHAGNFADILKHLVLVLCLDRLKQKDTPFFVLDAHAGCGVYDLNAAEAQKTREYESGISRLMGGRWDQPDLKLFTSMMATDFKRHRYLGSPMIAARMIRPQDRLLVNELHPQDIDKLKANMAGYKNVRVLHRDAYEVVRASLPPLERRGLVLIDPPYEIENDEFGILARQLKEWKKRWETGSYLIWYPEKAQQSPARFFDALKASGFKEFWQCSLALRPQENWPKSANTLSKMLKTGVILINPPYQIADRMAALQPDLERALDGQITQDAVKIDKTS